MKLPHFLSCCLPRRVSPSLDSAREKDKNPDLGKPPTKQRIKFHYTNLDDSEDGKIFEQYVPKEAVESWLEVIAWHVQGHLGYLDGTDGIHVPVSSLGTFG